VNGSREVVEIGSVVAVVTVVAADVTLGPSVVRFCGMMELDQ